MRAGEWRWATGAAFEEASRPLGNGGAVRSDKGRVLPRTVQGGRRRNGSGSPAALEADATRDARRANEGAKRCGKDGGAVVLILASLGICGDVSQPPRGRAGYFWEARSDGSLASSSTFGRDTASEPCASLQDEEEAVRLRTWNSGPNTVLP
jgi:hypothetical protein